MLFYGVLRGGDSNSCKGDRRLRRKQGAGAGAVVAEGKPPTKGCRLMRAPQTVQCPPSYVPAGKNSPADCF